MFFAAACVSTEGETTQRHTPQCVPALGTGNGGRVRGTNASGGSGSAAVEPRKFLDALLLVGIFGRKSPEINHKL